MSDKTKEEKAIEVLDITAGKFMLRWDRQDFQESHPRLFKTIIQSMIKFSNENTSQQTAELEAEVKRLRDVNKELEQGLKSSDNLRQSLADIKEAIGAEYHPANWKQLWNNISDFISYQEDILKKHSLTKP